MKQKNISILGSTGSIGKQTLDIVKHYPHAYNIIGLAAGKNITLLKQQILEFKPKIISVTNPEDASELTTFCKKNNQKITIEYAEKGLQTISSTNVDLLIVAIVGTTAIKPTYTAIQNQIPIALACKEVLVSAGDLITELAKKNNVPIIPIDSEHAATQQCLSTQQNDKTIIESITLTASGGPFWNLPKKDFKTITKEKALQHPTWSMGNKISIDSATMVNKGLEIIEAHHLFNIDYNKLNVTIHKQSIIHAMVEFIDGNILAHLSPTDMRFPIQYALDYPHKKQTKFQRLNIHKLAGLTFEEPDNNRFPLLNIAIEAGKHKKSYPAVFNAANEAIVSLFLQDKITFLDIHTKIESILSRFNHYTPTNIDDIIAIDSMIKHDIFQTA